jgi:hypothetical protein
MISTEVFVLTASHDRWKEICTSGMGGGLARLLSFVSRPPQTRILRPSLTKSGSGRLDATSRIDASSAGLRRIYL